MSLSETMSPADFAAVTGNNNDAFGGNGAWWIIILFLFVFCGWGNNGWNGNSGAADNYVLASDFATLQRQIDSATSSLERKGDAINSGLCDGFYAMNTSLLNGFAGVNNAINTSGYETRNAIQAGTVAGMQNTNAIQTQIASCCCDNKEAIANLNYNLATQSCATNTAIANSTRDIVDSQTANTRAILDALNAQAIAAKDEKIAEQNQTIFGLQLAASQSAQNNYLINQLRPAPVPAFSVGAPYQFTCNCGKDDTTNAST